MSIQWYPGHMTKARREIAESMPKNDVVIEVLDARLPRSSENPVITEIRRQKPVVKVLSKSDLADESVTTAWIRYFESRAPLSLDGGETSGAVMAIAIRSDRKGETKNLIFDACKQMAPHRVGPSKPLRAIVLGVPNVGKSTLINTLMDRKVAKVGDEPAVTKSQQRVVLENGIALSDNPGIMWPKIDNEQDGLRLAFAGSIPDTAFDAETVAIFGARFLSQYYPKLLMARYKISNISSENEPRALLEEIGRKRGCLRGGGVIDMDKAAGILIHDFRSGTLGRISLEAPR